jgi:HlyD family secretion protein
MTRPIPAPRGALITGLCALALLVLGPGLWSVTARIDGAVIAPGRVEVEDSRQIVQHPEGGLVSAVLVRDGDLVGRGQSLVRLDDAEPATELAVAAAQYAELLAERGRLEAERDGLPAIRFPAELRALASPASPILIEAQRQLFGAGQHGLAQDRDRLARRAAAVASQIEGLEAQRRALARQAGLIDAALARQAVLAAKDLSRAGDTLALEREGALLAGRLAELDAATAAAAAQATDLSIEAEALQSRRREAAMTRLRDLRGRETELAGRRAALLARIDRLTIRAPVAGRVLALQVGARGSVLRPAEPLLYIVPQDRPMVVSARVAAAEAGALHVGMPVTLRSPAAGPAGAALPEGRLARLSPDALTDSVTGAAYFEAQIVLPPEDIRNPAPAGLRPGLPVEVFIRTGARSPLHFLLEPIAAHFNRAFRES